MTAIHVGLGKHRVAIRGETPEVLTALRTSFAHMLGPEPDTAAGEIDVREVDGRYHARSPGAEFQDRSPVAVTQWVQHQAIELLISARDDLLWFHGAAAGYAGRAVVFPGRRGRGKSTLVTSLWLQGWTFLTDDILPVDPRNDQVLPFPRLPAVRLDPGRDLPDEELRRVPKKQVPLTQRVEGGALPLAAIVLPEARRRGPTELAACSTGEAVLTLLEGCWNFARHREAALRYLATLGPRLPVCRLWFANPTVAAELLTRWAEGLPVLPQPELERQYPPQVGTHAAVL